MRQPVYVENLFYSFEDFDNLFSSAVRSLPEELYATAKAILYLAWTGVKQENAGEILKSDVYSDCIYDRSSDVHWKPNRRIIEYLRHYSELEVCADNSVNGDYLLRTLLLGHIDKHMISMQVSRFKARLANNADYGRLCYSVCYKSGLYIRVFHYEQLNGGLPYYSNGRPMSYGGRKVVDTVFETEFSSARKMYDVLGEYKQFSKRMKEQL